MPRRACADCLDVCDREDYSKNQWRKGVGESRCTWCVEGVDKPVRRTCAACARLISIDDYSNNQWYKGPGVSRCRWCVQGVEAPTSSRRQKSARENDSFAATFEAHYVFAEGAFRYVYEGEYTVGRRRGEKCVVKMFKNNSEVYEASFFEMDIKAVDKALHIIEQWNAMGFIDKTIQLNVPQVWEQTTGAEIGRKQLVEPFIHNWQKFNSNSGWNDDYMEWGRIMQALSHYSYHVSSGQFVLCDLQGGISSDGAILTDPVILSRNRAYGVTDLGPDAIRNFFHHHVCNEFCRDEWTQPKYTYASMYPEKSTSMKELPRHVATRGSRAPLSAVYEEDSSDDYSSDDY